MLSYCLGGMCYCISACVYMVFISVCFVLICVDVVRPHVLCLFCSSSYVLFRCVCFVSFVLFISVRFRF